ncbi:phosphopantothenoylcysteine decarboxylase [Streptococcus urinalis FB127-CNA-2]|uniref:Phosphopantothenoylcysteine decarboxylase n=1 Tax=Streptococcus urinalis 2285-97 TaxID=764291 RepID=G5KG86_9STRE|nr:phosphopantothenoylcysteine decarboxylase [Streptococcus urinalis]EHJ56129.1 phosphopantothenoylcysteine decarboxylase [Streptococcus urinalis 2285-97]EKS22296.1 phosphopantothenoylcysteine decarboxylase [Streptococcus urinalis FB127-CNA-2]VEF32108.1 phosphopantothenoylcysteine decarboxylase [Streptococcus urinalis]
MNKQITLAVTGSIAAYKSADLVSLLTKHGYDVHVIMTKAATQFITPLTLQVLSKHPVSIDVMEELEADKINHIALGKSTDLFIVAPASANTIAHLANGFANNMVTSFALALPQSTPKFFAPAMNTNMYLNPITQENLNKLKTYGYQEIEPKSSLLACGDIGKGALATIDDIVSTVNHYFEN